MRSKLLTLLEAQSAAPGRRALLWALGLGGLLLLVLHAAHFFTPYWNYDDLWWLTMGRVMGAGGALYRHAMDTKAPLFLYIFYWADLVGFGNIELGLTLLIWGFKLATAALVYLLGRRFLGHGGGLLAGLLYIAGSLSIKCQISQSPNPEQFVLLPLALGLYFGLPQAPSRAAWRERFLAGLALGAAFGFRPQLGLLLLPLGLAGLWGRRLGRRRELALFVAEGLALTAGFVLVVGLIALFFFLKGDLDLLILYVFDLQSAYVGEGFPPLGKILGTLFSRLLSLIYSSPFVWLLALWGIGRACRKSSAADTALSATPALFRFLLLWQSAAFLTILPGFKLAHAYFGVLLLGNSLFAAAVAGPFLARAKPWTRRLALVGLVGPVLFFFGESWIHAAYWQGLMPYESTLDYRVKGLDHVPAQGPVSVAKIDKRDFLSGLIVYFNRPSEPDLSRLLRAKARPNDQLFVWGFAPELYYLSGLAPASRFYTSYHLTGQMRDPSQHFDLRAPAFRLIWKQAMDDLRHTRPRFIVDAVPGSRLDTLDPVSAYPELQSLLNERYVVLAVIDQMTLYELKPGLRQGPLLWQ